MIEDCVFSGNKAEIGGAIHCELSANLTLRSCIFSANMADNRLTPLGGGIGGGMNCVNSSPRLDDCAFIDNIAEIGGGTAASLGGGMSSTGGAPVLNCCTFLRNRADIGGGLHGVTNSSPRLTDCTFTENAGHNGGGMMLFGATTTILRSVFSRNTAVYGGGAWITGNYPDFVQCMFMDNSVTAKGGGLTCSYTQATLRGCTFAGNSAATGGGISCFFDSRIALTSCTFSDNGADLGGGVALESGSLGTAGRCILAFSDRGEAVYCDQAYSTATLTCTDVHGNAGGDWVGCLAGQLGQDGNIDADPLFCDRGSRDFTLDGASPCAPGNAGACLQIGAWPVGCGTTAAAPATWGEIKAAFRDR